MYKIPLRQIYTGTFVAWVKETFWCHVVIRLFPFALDLYSDSLKGYYLENPSAFFEQYEPRIRAAVAEHQARRLLRKKQQAGKGGTRV